MQASKQTNAWIKLITLFEWQPVPLTMDKTMVIVSDQTPNLMDTEFPLLASDVNFYSEHRHKYVPPVVISWWISCNCYPPILDPVTQYGPVYSNLHITRVWCERKGLITVMWDVGYWNNFVGFFLFPWQKRTWQTGIFAQVGIWIAASLLYRKNHMWFNVNIC